MRIKIPYNMEKLYDELQKNLLVEFSSVDIPKEYYFKSD